MTTTALYPVRDRALLFDPIAEPGPRRSGFKRLVWRIRMQLALARVRADLMHMPGFVLRDIDVDAAVYSAMRVLVRRSLTPKRAARRSWTS
jgi:hypothetical protein